MGNIKVYENIKRDILSRINTVNTNEGSFVDTMVSPGAMEMEKNYVLMEHLYNNMFLENLSSGDLERKSNEYGLERKDGTKAIAVVVIQALKNTIVPINTLVSTEYGLNYLTTKELRFVNDESLEVKVEAENIGVKYNADINEINNLPISITGVISVNNETKAKGGTEIETDEELLDRLLLRLRMPSTSGNKYHYLSWAKEIPGVGDARIIPRWQKNKTIATVKEILDNVLQKQNYTDEEVSHIIDVAMRYALSVKTIIIDSNKQPASQDLINNVQEHIDPNSLGIGEGQAPIGAFCTVASAVGKHINISVAITKGENYSLEQIKFNIEENITNYLKEIAFKKNLVSYAQIGSLILSVDGVLDYTDLKINEEIENITIDNEEVAMLGEVVLSE